jgi:hypothetical protein
VKEGEKQRLNKTGQGAKNRRVEERISGKESVTANKALHVSAHLVDEPLNYCFCAALQYACVQSVPLEEIFPLVSKYFMQGGREKGMRKRESEEKK